MQNSFFIKQIHSTNALLWELIREKNPIEGFVVRTDYQTAGKGQAGNSWESEKGKNLLFSMVLYPHHIAPASQFLLSQLVSVAIKNVLDKFVDNITVKWPNDIYHNDSKIGGILIENSLQGTTFKSVVIGVGLNINQKLFRSNAPNPVSLIQITGRRLNRKQLLQQISKSILDLYHELDADKIRAIYNGSLYRKTGFHEYNASGEVFSARIISIHPDGQLELETRNGERKKFYFKEVQFVLKNKNENV